MSFKARYYDGRTSAVREVEISLYADGRLTVTGDTVLQDASVGELKISERIGNTPRRIAFADGATCETEHNDLLDQWLAHLGAHSREHRVFQLERRWQIALLALLFTAVGTWAFMRFGLPVAADYTARVLPRSVDTAIGEGGFQTMERLFFGPSELSAQRQAELQALFATMVRDLGTDDRLRLELRSSPIIGPNAFALPSGIVVVTDELVALSRDDGEIESVLAHEIGHVVHRHSLRMLLQSSASALLMFTLLGDVNSVSALAASLPTVLVHAKFSRDFEREADDYSYSWLQRRGIPSHRFGDLLRRIEAAQSGQPDDDQAMSYFSSHPQTQERARD